MADTAYHTASTGFILKTGCIVVSPEDITLAHVIDDLLNFRRFGHALSECYGDEQGAKWWAEFVSPEVQTPLKGTPYEYYAVTEEILGIHHFAPVIADLVFNDPDFDPDNLIVVEKGSGSENAVVNKTLVQLEAFSRAGMNTRLYVTREHSPAYREVARKVFSLQRPDIVCLTQDVDYNRDDPPLMPLNEVDCKKLEGLDTEKPRIVFEFGTSRSNIATVHPDVIPYDALHATFAHDRKVCRNGGILIVASDCNQDSVSMEGSFSHPAHAEFSKNLLRRGIKRGVLSGEFNLDAVSYKPVWVPRMSLLRHTLISHCQQSFGLYRHGVGMVDATMRQGLGYRYSHSFRWPQSVIQDAACLNGFKSLGTFLRPDCRVPIFVFKAV